MKKKVLLTTTAMALVAAMTVSADVNFSGSFDQGYKFAWKGDDLTVSNEEDLTPGDDNFEASMYVNFADSDGLWSVDIGNQGKTGDAPFDLFGSDNALRASATVSLTKALAADENITLPFDASFTIGNSGSDTALSAYNNVTGKNFYKLKAHGLNNVSNVTVSYADPNTNATLVTAKLAGGPISGGQCLGISAIVNPIDGVSVSAGYAYGHGKSGYVTGYDYAKAEQGAEYTTASTDADYNSYLASTSLAYDYGFNGAATVDIAKLAQLTGYTAKASVMDTYLNDGDDSDNNQNTVAVNVQGGAQDITGYVQFAMTSYKLDDKDSQQSLWFGAAYSGIEKVGLDGYYRILKLSKVADNQVFGADATYTMGGITYKVNMEYATAKGDDTFSITPQIGLSY
jgi:hypothetical protein